MVFILFTHLKLCTMSRRSLGYIVSKVQNLLDPRLSLVNRTANLTSHFPSTVSAVSSTWREEPSVNGGGWTDMPLKISGQIGGMEGTKWSNIHTATHYRAPPKRQSWAQETQGRPKPKSVCEWSHLHQVKE